MDTPRLSFSTFEQNAADLSVDHPRVVEHYRIAREIALRDASGQATTEDLRRAVVSYRHCLKTC